ncbi:uncharacterized protein LY79DRAFT_673141 [Colletotrichum navitas]|uniref:Sodium/calcium exchanger membrane region domain-containing protein n=1 Tax=Colletotrichum navitas TaxID=681940 RepID=A0AAD8PQK3_9PEZI|nr:uncharacterized protein LY79DRAFT_673141 [Colletotrichum navitas]KAK1574101.1 hypothetical protein LY79DRAFT_673141 [Colletotrichum navitas]
MAVLAAWGSWTYVPKTTFGSIVEIILFVVLVSQHDSSSSVENGDYGNLIPIIQAAIFGSILTNLLLCLGLCFFVGGIRHASQNFALLFPRSVQAFFWLPPLDFTSPVPFIRPVKSETVPELPGLLAMHEKFTDGTLQTDVLHISRATSIALIIAFLLYIWYQASSQHTIFDEVIEADEHHDVDREADMEKPKFTMTEIAIALVISLVLVTLLLIFLVQGIEHAVVYAIIAMLAGTNQTPT